MSDLRARLQWITSSIDLENQPFFIESIKSEYKHSVSLITHASNAPHGNCFEFALAIRPELAHFVGEFEITDLYAGSAFILWLLKRLELDQYREVQQNHDLVLYFNEGTVTHAGNVKNKCVVSKWGRGHIYEHGLKEVPEKYGDSVQFFKPIEPKQANALFVDYIREHQDFQVIEALFEERLAVLIPGLQRKQ